MLSAFRVALCAGFICCIASCASDVVRQSTTLLPPTESLRQQIEIAQEARVESSSGYGRILTKGSIWEFRGTLPQGAVYKRVNGIFTIEGKHVHEAFLVIADNQLVGFYLPVEQAYSPSRPVTLTLK